MISTRYLVILAVAAGLGGLPAVAHGQLNLLCPASVSDWCKLLADEFGKETGVKVTLVLPPAAAGRSRCLPSRRASRKADVWFGGLAQAHLRAAKFGLVDEYASPMVAQLQPWAQKVAEQSKSTSFGVYARVLGIGYNSALATQKKLAPPACWKDLVKPGYAGEVHIADPNASGSTYLAIAAMAQLFGEDEAFKYLKTMYKAPRRCQEGTWRRGREGRPPKGVRAEGSRRRRRQGRPAIARRRQGWRQGRCRTRESAASGRQRDRRHRLRRRCRRRSGERRAGQGRRAVRRNDLRGRRAFDRERREESRQREEVRRLGARREGAGARRQGEAVRVSGEHRRCRFTARAEVRRDQVHQLRRRPIREVGCAKAPHRPVAARVRRRLSVIARRALRGPSADAQRAGRSR